MCSINIVDSSPVAMLAWKHHWCQSLPVFVWYPVALILIILGNHDLHLYGSSLIKVISGVTAMQSIHWRAKQQPSQMANLRQCECWGDWETICRHDAKDTVWENCFLYDSMSSRVVLWIHRSLGLKTEGRTRTSRRQGSWYTVSMFLAARTPQWGTADWN